MASLELIANSTETRAAEPTRVKAYKRVDPVAQAAAKLRAEQDAQRRNDLRPATLELRLDPAAGWFVQTWSDPVTDETLRRYPSEQQLAFSRAVTAYLRARIES